MTTQTETMIDEREEMDTRGCLLPEAGGIAFTDLWSKTGAKISLTARATTPMEALDDLVAAVRYGMDVYQMTPAPPQAMAQRTQPTAPEPTPQANGAPAPVVKSATQTPEGPVGGAEEIVTFTVEKIEAQMTPNGKPQFKVFGGAFSKYGVTCWPETLAGQFELDGIKTGDSWAPSGLTARALRIDGKVKKVVGFVS